MTPIGIGIIGFGKIAADQHVPAIKGNERFQLLATSSRSRTGPHASYSDWRQMVQEVDGLQAVAITTPPGPRPEIAAECARAGLHVLLEKPPAATLGEVEALRGANPDISMFATWHARHHPAVLEAADLLAGKTVTSLAITWHEDVDKWHPDQDWIWQSGGFGVFDPGINAFSIATRIMPQPLFVRSATLHVPENAQTPIAVDVDFSEGRTASLDWRRSEGEEWTIALETADGLKLRLENGGADLIVNGEAKPSQGMGEYPSIYAQFLDLIDNRRSDFDVSPLRLVADCLLVGERRPVAAVERR